jgi:hypothetical protein
MDDTDSIQVTITKEEDVLLNRLRLSWRSDLFSSRLEVSHRFISDPTGLVFRVEVNRAAGRREY